MYVVVIQMTARRTHVCTVGRALTRWMASTVTALMVSLVQDVRHDQTQAVCVTLGHVAARASVCRTTQLIQCAVSVSQDSHQVSFHNVYATGQLCNQSFHVMTSNFRHFAS